MYQTGPCYNVNKIYWFYIPLIKVNKDTGAPKIDTCEILSIREKD